MQLFCEYIPELCDVAEHVTALNEADSRSRTERLRIPVSVK